MYNPSCGCRLRDHFYARSESSAIRLHAPQLQGKPVVAVTGVFKEYIGEHVAGIGTTHNGVNILVTIVVQVAEGYAMPFLQVANSSGSRDILEKITPVIAKHPIRH